MLLGGDGQSWARAASSAAAAAASCERAYNLLDRSALPGNLAELESLARAASATSLASADATATAASDDERFDVQLFITAKKREFQVNLRMHPADFVKLSKGCKTKAELCSAATAYARVSVGHAARVLQRHARHVPA